MFKQTCRQIGRGVLLAGLATGALACQAETTKATSTTSTQTSFQPLGYFMMVDGTLGVIDLFTLDVKQKIKVGHTAVHQVAVLPGNRVIYTGNPDTNEIVKLTISDDGKSYTSKVIAKSPLNLHLFAASPSGDKVVMTSRIELRDDVVSTPSNLPDDGILIIDTATDQIIKTLTLQSPAMAEFAPDGKTVYVSNVHHASVSVVDTSTWTETARWNVTDQKLPALGADGKDRVSPDGMTVSRDGKWVATADYDLQTVSLFEIANPANRRQIAYTALPHDVRFSPDSKELWVTDFERHPKPADEVGNAKMVTHIRVFEVAGLTQTREIKSPVMIQRTALPQYSKNAYLTTGLGGLVVFDRTTGELVGEQEVGGLGRPVICGMSTY